VAHTVPGQKILNGMWLQIGVASLSWPLGFFYLMLTSFWEWSPCLKNDNWLSSFLPDGRTSHLFLHTHPRVAFFVMWHDQFTDCQTKKYGPKRPSYLIFSAVVPLYSLRFPMSRLAGSSCRIQTCRKDAGCLASTGHSRWSLALFCSTLMLCGLFCLLLALAISFGFFCPPYKTSCLSLVRKWLMVCFYGNVPHVQISRANGSSLDFPVFPVELNSFLCLPDFSSYPLPWR
jgi:hypothetical protein